MFKNKKAQYYEKPSYSGMSPVFVIGIACFVLPIIGSVFGWNFGKLMSSVFYFLGVTLIIIGGALSIYNASN